jgi:hypothetical protein
VLFFDRGEERIHIQMADNALHGFFNNPAKTNTECC